MERPSSATSPLWLVWQPQDDDSTQWRLESTGGGTFRADYTDHGDTVRYILAVCRANGLLIGDLRSRDANEGVLPLHQYGIISRADTLLRYRVLDDDWLREYVAQHRRELAHVDLSGGEILVIAEAASIRRFVVRHQKDVGAWLESQPYVWRGRPQ